MDQEELNLKNQRLWRELHKEGRHRPKYPREDVIRFVFKNFSRDGSEKILDLGCGAGRHVIFMASEGILPYGLDFSDSGVEYTKSMLVEMGSPEYAENIKVGSAADIPFSDEMFDGLICIGVLYYMNVSDIKRAVHEIYRVLRSGGKALILIRSTDDYRCKSSSAVPTEERNTFIIHEGDASRSASCEDGMLMHFFEKEEIQELFQDFSSIVIDRVTVTHDNGTYADDDYLVICTK